MKEYLKSVRTNSILHYVSDKFLICSSENTLFQSRNCGESWEKVIEIPCSIITRILIKNRLIRRLLRQYVYHVVPQQDIWTIFAFGKIYVVNISTKKILSINSIHGSRPLVITSYNDDIFYGEYTSNKERNKIKIYKSSGDKISFEEWFSFNNIRHIHSIQSDPVIGKLYVTTGDNNDECFIGYFEDKTFIPIAYGNQQARAIQLLFDEAYIYYATDAPDEENFIFRIDRNNHSIEKMQKVGGPVFYGFNNGEILMFSTICEPSLLNNEKNVELWASLDGKNWKSVFVLDKDIFHMKLFQYGQIIFPAGKGSKDFIYFTAFATEFDQTILKFSADMMKDILIKN